MSRLDRHPTEVARLRGARLTVAQETPKGRTWDEAKIKNMTGGDEMTGRFMRGDFFDFDPTHKLMIAGNHKPSLRSVDEATRRRLLLIPFTVTIAKRDLQLGEKLKIEWPVILRWMIDGCVEWRSSGLLVPKSVRDATDKYLADQDQISQWLGDCTEYKERSFTTTKALFGSWRKWCEERGGTVGVQQNLTDALIERGLEYKRRKKDRGFMNLALTDGGESQTEADLGDDEGDERK